MGAAKPSDYLKECIADAIIILIKEKPIEKISVDEIVKKAGVGRATYFRAFHSKREAVTFKFIKMWEQYCELNDVRVRDSFDLNNARHFFAYNYSIRHILEIVYQAGLQDAIHESFYRIVLTMEHRSDAPKLYREKFYAHGLYGLLDEWVKRGFSETPDEMAQIIVQIVSTPYSDIAADLQGQSQKGDIVTEQE